MNSSTLEHAIRNSWQANAAAWTTAVREQLIASRRAGTDVAILNACARLKPQRVLDVGCGEGWLARALAKTSVQVVGIDSSSSLVEAARAAGGNEQYEVLDYDDLIRDPEKLSGAWDAIICNFALFTDPLAPLLAALGQLLAPSGRLLIQTVHPWTAVGDRPYANEWREESFADFGVPFPAAMPWFFRTLESWIAEVHRANLTIERLEEPFNPETGQPLSVLFTCNYGRGTKS